MTATGQPESSLPGQVGQVGQGFLSRVVPVGRDRGLYRDPVPPGTGEVPEAQIGEPVPGSCPGKPTFALTLQALPDPSGVPVANRLRRLLKAALRSYGFRCITIQPAPPEGPTGDRGDNLGPNGE